MSDQRRVYSLSSNAFIELPWPKKMVGSAGMGVGFTHYLKRFVPCLGIVYTSVYT
jgi:hypothetical protein